MPTKIKTIGELLTRIKESYPSAPKALMYDYLEEQFGDWLLMALNVNTVEDDTLEGAWELADGWPSVYTGDLLDWYGEDLHRIYWADEALKEAGRDASFIQIMQIGAARYAEEEMREVWDTFRDAVEAAQQAETEKA